MRPLIAPLDPHARREVARAERFDAGLQTLEAAGQPPHHWIGAHADRGRDERQHEEEPEDRTVTVVPAARDEPPAVRQVDRASGRAAPAAQPAAALANGVRHRQ